MAKRSKKEKKSRVIMYIIAIAIAFIITLSRSNFLDINNNLTLDENSVAVYFLDVGQGHCTIFQDGNKGVLIDAGEKENAKKILDFLEEKGISKLEYAVATHAHSDHIGALANVLQKTDCNNVYLTDLDDEYLPTTKQYYNLLETIDDKNLKLTFVSKETIFTLGKMSFVIVPPAEQSKNANNTSLMVKMKYNNASFLVIGDAEKKEQRTVLAKYPNFDFSADIFLMGHHGSNNALEERFLSKVNMKTAIISCAEGNSYGHPHKEAIEYLNKNNITYYRTDKVGTITIITDGSSYNITTEKGE